MDATTAVALSVAIDRAVPPALEAAMEVERLKAELQLSTQKHLAFVRAECDRCDDITALVREALDRLQEGVDNRQVFWGLVFGVLAATETPDIEI
jgi:hypothetical protein